MAQSAPESAKASEEAKTDEIDIGSAASVEGVKLKMSGKAGDENALIDIDCDDATLADVLRQFRHAVGANIISTDSSNLQQRVSVSLHQVPWLESLQSILNTRHFRLEPRGGIYFVSEENTAVPKFTRTYTLNHASAEELAEMFNKNYGKKAADGKVIGCVASFFPGANVIVVTADEKTKNHVRSEMGMVFQGSALFDSMTIEENVMFPLDMFTEMSSEEKLERVNFCLHRVELPNVNKLYPAELSGGMKKRAAIARAIACNPRYLFCDEPNSGLDPKTSLTIDDLLIDITHEFGITTIVNTHDLNSVITIGETISFIYEGHLAWRGNSDNVLTSDNQQLNDFIFAQPLTQRIRQKL